MNQLRVQHLDTLEELVRTVVAAVCSLPAASHVAITGGRMGRRINESILTLRVAPLTMWFSDERFLPAGHADRNDFELPGTSSVAVESALGPDNSPSPQTSAAEYEQRFFARVPNAEVDIAILSAGDDGHVASLFPGHLLLDEVHAGIRAIVDSPKPPASRVTWNLPLLNNAQRVFVIAAGPEKAEVAAKIIAADPSLPAALVRGKQETVLFQAP